MSDQNIAPSFSPIDYWHMILRRKWLVIAIFSACVVGGGILCVVWPASYRSSTLILVESQKIPENYVQALVGPNIEERLNSIQQQVMSRTLLTQMIQEFDLYPDTVRRDGFEAVIERLRKDILVTTSVTRSARNGVVDAFAISFAHQNPQTAMNVTAKLASQFIDENLRSREQLVAGASEFIEDELTRAKERLEAQERSISLFKTKYMGELPEQVQANLSTLDRLSLQHGTTVDALQRAADRLSLIEKTFKEYEALGPTMAGTVQGPGGAVVVDPSLLRLKELEKTLTTLAAEYKDNYPDIITLKQEIQALKAEIGNRAGENKESDNATTVTKETKPIDTYLRELGRQREEAKLEIATLKERLFRIKDQMKEYEVRVEKAPAREQELMLLERDYGNLKENYRSLLDKKLNARLSENLEKRQKGEQFRIVDPANLPQTPETPNRLKIMLLALALGCGLGVGSVVALETFRPVFRRSDEVENLLQLRVLASIPNFRLLLGHMHKLLSGGAMTSRSIEAMKDRFLSAPDPDQQRNGTYVGTSAERGVGLPAVATRGLSGKKMDIGREMDLIAKWSPLSIVAEQFRVAAARLVLLQSADGDRVTVLTSAIKGEGKSVVASNLAYVLARNLGKSTLLIDGDLKCPMVHQCMGIPQFPGLRDVLEGERSVDSCLHRVGDLPLWILPSGLVSGRTLELYDTRKIAEMLKKIKKQYEHIIIDAPPILPLADMHMLAEMADTLILVVRAGLTPRVVVEKAVRTIGAARNACIILNGLEAAGVPSYMQDTYEYLSEKKEVGSA
jgi:polysaccharide chain length determinant protein (PEP-CTERM system associated)